MLEINSVPTIGWYLVSIIVLLASIFYTAPLIMTGINARKALVNLCMNELKDRCFSKTLHSYSPWCELKAPIEGKNTNHSQFSYKVPKNLCILKGNSAIRKEAFAASSILAVFDELSTYSFMLADKNARSGVSVSLSVDVLEDALADDIVHLEFYTDKVGLNLGFCSMTMKNINGEILAKGKHIKYLPGGFLLDRVGSDNVLPFFMKIYSLFGNKLIKLLRPNLIFDRVERDELSDAFNKFNITPVESVVQTDKKTTNTSLPFIGKLKCQSFMNNILGLTHGGCILMSIEQTSRLQQKYKQEICKTVDDSSIKAINISYLNGVSGGEILISLQDDPLYNNPSHSVGTIKTASGKLCCQFEVIYNK